MKFAFRHSLSGRLTLLFVLMALLFVLLVGASIGGAFRSQFRHTLRPHLNQYLAYVREDLGSPPERARAEALARKLSVTIQVEGPGERWSTDGSPVDLSAAELRHPVRGRDHAFGELGGRRYLIVHDGDYTLGFSVPERRRGGWGGAVPLIVLLLILIVLYHGTRRLVAPIATIREGVERIGGGDLSHRIDVRRRDELGELAETINAMAGDLDALLEAKRQLLLAVSHELRTPLTRARVATELVDDTAQRERVARELKALERLIEELLESERLDGRHGVLDRRPLALDGLVREVVEESFARRPPALQLESVTGAFDGPRLKLLIRNLLDNAERHTPEGAPAPEVYLRGAGESMAELVVRDHGIGIAPEHLDRVTEPFYRVDSARHRATGGHGLGLYLCRRIAEAHGGSLWLTSEGAGHGTRAVVCLPIGDPIDC